MAEKKEILFFLLLSVFIFSSCSKTDDLSKNRKSVISIGLNRSVKSAPIAIAEESKYFFSKQS